MFNVKLKLMCHGVCIGSNGSNNCPLALQLMEKCWKYLAPPAAAIATTAIQLLSFCIKLHQKWPSMVAFRIKK